MEQPKTRICKKCGEEKPLEEFCKDKAYKFGYIHTCKYCKSNYDRKYRQENLEKVRDVRRKHYQKNREKELERSRKYRQENSEKVRGVQRKYRQENSEKVRGVQRKYRQENSEKVRGVQRKYRQENQEKLIEGSRKYRESNPEKMKINNVIKTLKEQTGLTKDEIPEELIQYKLLTRELNQKIKEHGTS